MIVYVHSVCVHKYCMCVYGHAVDSPGSYNMLQGLFLTSEERAYLVDPPGVWNNLRCHLTKAVGTCNCSYDCSDRRSMEGEGGRECKCGMRLVPSLNCWPYLCMALRPYSKGWWNSQEQTEPIRMKYSPQKQFPWSTVFLGQFNCLGFLCERDVENSHTFFLSKLFVVRERTKQLLFTL